MRGGEVKIEGLGGCPGVTGENANVQKFPDAQISHMKFPSRLVFGISSYLCIGGCKRDREPGRAHLISDGNVRCPYSSQSSCLGTVWGSWLGQDEPQETLVWESRGLTSGFCQGHRARGSVSGEAGRIFQKDLSPMPGSRCLVLGTLQAAC